MDVPVLYNLNNKHSVAVEDNHTKVTLPFSVIIRNLSENKFTIYGTDTKIGKTAGVKVLNLANLGSLCVHVISK